MEQNKELYTAYFDGMCEPTNPRGNMGFGCLILNSAGEYIFKHAKYIPAKELNFQTSNNVAEYLGVIEIFKFLLTNNFQDKKIICHGDSKLVINQMNGDWGCNGGIYAKYFYEARKLCTKFSDINFVWIPREQNEICDALSKQEAVKNGCEFRIQPNG